MIPNYYEELINNEVKIILKSLLTASQAILADQFAGLYLYGSLATSAG